jgi:hypothetical protein
MPRLGSVSQLVLSVVAVGFAGCGSCNNGGTGGPDADNSCGDAVCADGEVCRYGECVPDPVPCDNGECRGDQWCDTSVNPPECLPYGVGPGGDHDQSCSRTAVPGVFVPGVQCEWLGPAPTDPHPDSANVLSAPMVADFGLGGSSEFSNPYIVLISYNGTDGGDPASQSSDPAFYGVIRILDGRTCELVATLDNPTLVAATSVALGDLNGDGHPEIVATRSQGGLVAWTYNPVTAAWEIYWQTASTDGDLQRDWTGPAIHDLDDDGHPEVIHFGWVYDGQTGAALDETIAPSALDPYGNGYIPVIADVDADGLPELVTGQRTYAWDTGARHWTPETTLNATGGRIAVADFGTFGADPANDDRDTLDGIAEVAFVNAGVVRVWTLAGRQVFTGDLQGATPGNGGPPTIADFDGDGRVEMAVAGGSAYTVFDPDCVAGGTPATCASGRTDGILWFDASQDLSSNVTGSSVFDFDGDGRNEVVYADECFTRVYDGVTGQVEYSHYRTSCTWHEYPIVADVDADFNAEIVVGSNTNCNVSCPLLDPIFDGIACDDDSDCPSATTCGREAPTDTLGRCRCTQDTDCGGENFVCRDPIAGPSAAGQVCRAEHPAGAANTGMRVLSDNLDRWVNTRRIWNQHAYSVTNVNEDGTIPRTSQWLRNWDDPKLNTFRANAPGDGLGNGLVPTPDLTVHGATVECSGGDVTVTTNVCNRGTEPVGVGVPITIYQGAAAVCVAQTAA